MAEKGPPSIPLTPEYVAENEGYKLVAVSSFVIALQIVAVALRFVGRRVQKAPFWVDDLLILPALV